MDYSVYISEEDYAELKKAFTLLGKIIYNADQTKQEAEHEKNFEKLNIQKRDVFDEIQFTRRFRHMPQTFQKIFTEQWIKDHTRLKPNGVYEIRCNINKIPVSSSSKNLDIAIKNFATAVANLENAAKSKKTKHERVEFNAFAEKWLEVVKKPTVKPISYKSCLSVYNTHIKPYFRRRYIDDITAMQIQPLFSRIYKKGQTKAGVMINLLLNQIFKAAIAERIIPSNPMDGVTILKHHAKKGTSLTYSEEADFLQELDNSKFRLTFALMLFCGMRRAELASARIEDNFIVVKNGKQRLSDIQTERKIPITPMLARYLDGASKKDFKEATSHSCDLLSRAFKRFCPAHHLHELRHTFITRCQECGVPREVVSVWAGHSADSTMTSTVYTHFSEEFLLSEGKKVDYFERLYNRKND